MLLLIPLHEYCSSQKW